MPHLFFGQGFTKSMSLHVLASSFNPAIVTTSSLGGRGSISYRLFFCFRVFFPLAFHLPPQNPFLFENLRSCDAGCVALVWRASPTARCLLCPSCDCWSTHQIWYKWSVAMWADQDIPWSLQARLHSAKSFKKSPCLCRSLHHPCVWCPLWWRPCQSRLADNIISADLACNVGKGPDGLRSRTLHSAQQNPAMPIKPKPPAESAGQLTIPWTSLISSVWSAMSPLQVWRLSQPSLRQCGAMDRFGAWWWSPTARWGVAGTLSFSKHSSIYQAQWSRSSGLSSKAKKFQRLMYWADVQEQREPEPKRF